MQQDILDDFLPLLVKHSKEYQPGNPLDPKCNFGPLVDDQQFAKVLSFIELGLNEKAKLILGGKDLSNEMQGYYIDPTIFINVNNRMAIAQEEIFGPVLSVISFAFTST